MTAMFHPRDLLVGRYFYAAPFSSGQVLAYPVTFRKFSRGIHNERSRVNPKKFITCLCGKIFRNYHKKAHRNSNKNGGMLATIPC